MAIQQNSTVVIASMATNRGTMAINAGRLRYDATTGLGHTNTIFLGATASPTSTWLGIGASRVTVSNRIEVRSGSGSRTIANTSAGAATFAGAVLLDNNLILSNGAGGSLTFTGPFDFNAAQRFITLPSAHTATLASALSNDGGNGLVKQGAGELILGASNSIVGLYIDAGAVRYTGTTAHVRGNIGIGPGLASGDARLILETAGLTVTNRIESRSTGGTRNLDAMNTGGTITLSGSNVLSKELIYTVSSGGTLAVSGIVSGAGALIKLGAGTMILSGANIFSGNSYVSGGVMRISHGDALGTTAGTNTVASGAALEITGGISSPERMSIAGTGVSSGGALRNVSGNNLLSGSILVSDTSWIAVDGASDTLTLGGVISTPGASQNIVKRGPGRLSLTNNNTFTGQLDIQGGSVSVTSINSSAGANQPLGARTTSPGIRLGSTDFSGSARGTLRYAGPTDAILPKTIRLTEGSEGAIEVVESAVNLTNTAEISIGSTAASLYKLGAGRLVLDAVNTYQGQTHVSEGALRVVRNGSLGNTNDSDNQATYVASGAALEIAGNIELAERIHISGTGISGGGALRNIIGTNALFGRLFLSSAARINSDSGLLSITNATAITNTSALTVGGSGDVLLRTPLNTGANTLTKDGTGTLTVSGTNTYSGATAISNGTLVIVGSSANSAHTVGGGATLRGAGTVGALTVAGLVDPGNSVGDRANLNAGNLTLQTNGGMRVDISNVAGTPGVEWDQIISGGGSGTLTVNATAADPFVIYLNGNPTGWDNTASYSWRIVNAGSASGFATNKFTVNTTGFTPSLGGGSFSVTNSGGNLFLTFSPGTAGDIEVRGNGVLIAPGDTTPSLADHTLFGDVLTDGGTFQRVYTITNSGTAAIGIGNISFTGGNAGDFTVINQPPATLPAGGSTNITIEFNPGADGHRFTDLTFTNTVAGKTPYTFRIAGTGVTYNLAVLGNGVEIVDGDSTPSLTDHTDFGNVGVSGATLTRTYTITNTGNRPMGIGAVSIVGTHSNDFSVTAQPSSPIDPGQTTTFLVQFDPSAVGLRSAEVTFTNTSSTGKNPYNYAIQGTGVGSGISNFPTSLSFSSVLGSLPSPAFQAFSVSNVGLGTLTYSSSTNAAWLYLSNNVFTANPGAGNVHTAHVQYVGVMAAGTSNATITITGDSATTNSPKTISVTWTISALPDPTAVSATADGPQMVRLAWTKHASYDVMIVHRQSNAPSAPANGTAYNVGDAIGTDGTRVIYKGAGATLEHIVPESSTNHYAFYSINNNYYSPGVSAATNTPSFGPVAAIDQASYTNGVALTGLAGGKGWGTNAWGAGGGGWHVTNATIEVPNNYPARRANTFYLPNPGVNAEVGRVRYLETTYTTGRLYIAYTFRATQIGTGRYLGMQLSSNGSGKVYFGVPGGQTVLGVQESTTYGGTNSSYTINTGTGDIYTVIGRYDFGTREAAILGYYKTSTVPTTEPATWDATYTIPTAYAPALINSININMGSYDGQSLGAVRLDEIRIAQSWNALLERLGAPGIGLGPTSLTFRVMLGDPASSNQTFAITNVGIEDLVFTNQQFYGIGLTSWLSVSPSTGILQSTHSQIVTVFVNSAGTTNAGTFVATNRVAGNASNAPVDVVVTVAVTNIPTPTAFVATNDRAEMVRLSWNSGRCPCCCSIAKARRPRPIRRKEPCTRTERSLEAVR